MDKKHEKYKAPLKGNMPVCISNKTLECLSLHGIDTIGDLMNRWEMLSLVCKDRDGFKAMLKGMGVKGRNIDDVANFCATWAYRLQTDKERFLLYQKIDGKYIPVEALADRTNMSEGIYLVRTSGERGGVRRIRNLRCLADEVGWFKVGGKPILDFEMIAKVDYYAEAIIDFVLDKHNIIEMSPMDLVQHLAKLMLEVTENARANSILTESKSITVRKQDVSDFSVKL